jgi:hypothetical protein
MSILKGVDNLTPFLFLSSKSLKFVKIGLNEYGIGIEL